MEGYPIGIFYFIVKFRESRFVQFSTFLETKRNDLVSMLSRKKSYNFKHLGC